MSLHNSMDMTFVDPGSFNLHVAESNCHTNTQDAHKTAVIPTIPAKKNPRAKVLRASCKACSECKVKCERGKPTCDRCRNRGIDCTYEYSRRLGRPVRSKNPPTSTEEHQQRRPDSGNRPDRNQPVLNSLSQMQCRDNKHHEVFHEESNQTSINNTDSWSFEFQTSNDAPFENLDNDYSYADFDFTVPSPALVPYTPPLTYSTSFDSMKGSSPSQVFSPDVDYQSQSQSPPTNHFQHERPVNQSKATPASQTCDCISRMLTAPPQSTDKAFSAVPQHPMRTTCGSNTQKIYDVCTLVLTCSGVSFDEPIINSLAFIISHVLCNDTGLEIGPKLSELGDELGGTSRDPTALVRELALKMHASQPDFAKANGDMLIKYWLATLGYS